VTATRLTRAEKKAETRSRLLEAAAEVFAERGLQGASIDEVAERAGFTKGAFYASFDSKEQLFLAMLDNRFAKHLEEIDRVLASDEEPEDQARAGAANFVDFISSDPAWERLFFEFSAYASRNEDFRIELVARRRQLQERMTERYRRRAEELGVEPPFPMEEIARMTFAMADGIALQKLLDPESVPDDMYPTMLATFFAGVRAAVEQEEASPA
jgi:AcrR family transcriptional regulator